MHDDASFVVCRVVFPSLCIGHSLTFPSHRMYLLGKGGLAVDKAKAEDLAALAMGAAEVKPSPKAGAPEKISG